MTKQSKSIFPYRWNLADGYPAQGIPKHGKTVFGTFICGGGSSMGYKLAGYDHLGGVEIDPKVAKVYNTNHNPQHLFIEDLREFNKRTNLPKELYNLDLLDGSPPCSSFSMVGNREKDWGKQKKFAEGQALQTLDDLVYVYIDTIEKLKPKVAILENVKGLISGNAKAYCIKMKAKFEAIGYRVQVFLLNAASMGVPQKRQRAFFIGLKKDFKLPKLSLSFNYKQINFGQVDLGQVPRKKITGPFFKAMLKNVTKKGTLQIAVKSKGGKLQTSGFGYCCLPNQVPATLTTKGDIAYIDKQHFLHKREFCLIGSYPLDYKFYTIQPQYLIGMSVPPVMTAQISNQIYLQWLSKI